MLDTAQAYACPNCGISVLSESRACRRHVSPYIGMPREQHASVDIPRRAKVLSKVQKRIVASSASDVALKFAEHAGVELSELNAAQHSKTSRYLRRMLSYILYVHTTVLGKRPRIRSLAELFGHSYACVHKDIQKFRELHISNPDDSMRLEQELVYLETHFHS